MRPSAAACKGPHCAPTARGRSSPWPGVSVPRTALTQRHPDLKNDFYAQVRARGKTPDSEIRLRKQIVKLKELRVKDAKELSQWQTGIDHLVRAVNQLTVGNRQLRGALSQPSSRVRALPTQPRPHRIP